jgi:uncharacterized Zn-finger protein
MSNVKVEFINEVRNSIYCPVCSNELNFGNPRVYIVCGKCNSNIEVGLTLQGD